MLRGIDHNPGMSGPDRQVAGLRVCDSAEFVDPCVEVGRGRVVVREPGAFIEGVDQVRAVEGARVMTGIEGDPQNHQALLPAEGSRCGCPALIRLSQRGRDARQAEQKQPEGVFGTGAHHLFIARLGRAAQVPGVPPRRRKCSDLRCTLGWRVFLGERDFLPAAISRTRAPAPRVRSCGQSDVRQFSDAGPV